MVTKPLAESKDLEKFLEVYDLEYVDLQELDVDAASPDSEGENTLRSMKASLLRLYIIRKLYLCSLLAIPAVGGKPDLARWGAAIDNLETAAARTSEIVLELKEAMVEDDRMHNTLLFLNFCQDLEHFLLKANTDR
jgi:hypothetical protein